MLGLPQVNQLYPQLLFDLTETNGSVSAGKEYQTSSGVTVLFRTSGRMERKGWPAAGAGEVMQFVLERGGGEVLSAIATWLYLKLRGRVTSVRINRRSVPVTEASILDVLREAQGTSYEE